MARKRYVKKQVQTIDVHAMTGAEAKRAIERALAGCGPDVREFVVIHGYHGGTRLRDVARREVRSRRIAYVMQSLANPGQTTYILT